MSVEAENPKIFTLCIPKAARSVYSHGQELLYKFVSKFSNKLVKQLLPMTVCTNLVREYRVQKSVTLSPSIWEPFYIEFTGQWLHFPDATTLNDWSFVFFTLAPLATNNTAWNQTGSWLAHHFRKEKGEIPNRSLFCHPRRLTFLTWRRWTMMT